MSQSSKVAYGIGWSGALTLGCCFYIWLLVLFSTTTFYVWVGLVTVGCIAWSFVELRRARLVEDVPTATIHAAAQGYVELQGKANTASGTPLNAPLTAEPCCWWSLDIVRTEKNTLPWARSSVSKDLIRLRDGTGECLIDPDKAVVTGYQETIRVGPTSDPNTASKSAMQKSKYTFTERYLPVHARVIAVGMFRHLPRDFPTDTAGPATDILTKPDDGRELLLSTLNENSFIAYHRLGASFMYKFALVMLLFALTLEQTSRAITQLQPCAPEQVESSVRCQFIDMFRSYDETMNR